MKFSAFMYFYTELVFLVWSISMYRQSSYEHVHRWEHFPQIFTSP